jgi:hypothetical protein
MPSSEGATPGDTAAATLPSRKRKEAENDAPAARRKRAAVTSGGPSDASGNAAETSPSSSRSDGSMVVGRTVHFACDGSEVRMGDSTDNSMEYSSGSMDVEDRGEDGASRQLALQNACACGHDSAVARLLMTPGASTAVTTSNGLTLLHLVAQGSGSTVIARRLLRLAPALQHAKCTNGWTPALYAAQAGNWDVVSLLETWSSAYLADRP